MTALKFDPYAALAEIENSTGLRAVRAKRANQAAAGGDPAQTLADLARLALSPAGNEKTERGGDAPNDPVAWRTALARLDATSPPEGFALQRWRNLVEDARWIAEQHGAAAAALGWTASELFGLDNTLDGWGGLADRLDGARRVTLTDTVARWRSDEVEGWLWRKSLRSMRMLWVVSS